MRGVTKRRVALTAEELAEDATAIGPEHQRHTGAEPLNARVDPVGLGTVLAHGRDDHLEDVVRQNLQASPSPQQAQLDVVSGDAAGWRCWGDEVA
jgi:hypothetical protein